MCKHWLVYMAAAGGAPAAAHAADFTEIAQVISATPIYRQVAEPRQECRTETATAVGAATGAIVGDRIDNSRPAAAPGQIQRCRQIDSYRQEVSGYNVVYRYDNRDIAATLPYHPGNTVTVGVGIIGAAR